MLTYLIVWKVIHLTSFKNEKYKNVYSKNLLTFCPKPWILPNEKNQKNQLSLISSRKFFILICQQIQKYPFLFYINLCCYYLFDQFKPSFIDFSMVKEVICLSSPHCSSPNSHFPICNFWLVNLNQSAVTLLFVLSAMEGD